ncbi:MAG TPA: phytanoyl-CoA dioxygenase family protein [Caulobacteraceae bacterium]|jgi:ectoine hydroxylase-related dioxygenase (phytanoyl-CoA dioxygenase family)|nr:phytanoyl-CoA dioxygenase family protein [Caulobacteraceae bacterium]
MLTKARSFEMDVAERGRLERDGYVVREGVFSPAECAAIAADCEGLIADLEAARRHTKHVVGSYMFEIAREARTVVKWEPDAPEVVQGIEPFAHISPALKAWGLDARLTQPCKAIVGEDDVCLFTEKLNVKRARHGGPIVLHQDFPYWEPITPVASRVATAMVFLDDATLENGCLEVAAGTHTVGKWPQRTDDAGFGSFEMDMAGFDLTRLQPLQVPAGTVAWFGAFLVHRSLPNRSGGDRRALLYSYQPAGEPHQLELNRLFTPKPAA